MEVRKFCYSCTAPLDMPEFKGPSENFCKYCVDANGNLLDREVIQKGIAEWFKSWQPGIDDKKALERAAHFMQAMPAWAE